MFDVGRKKDKATRESFIMPTDKATRESFTMPTGKAGKGRKRSLKRSDSTELKRTSKMPAMSKPLRAPAARAKHVDANAINADAKSK